jgi:hypothetical protein
LSSQAGASSWPISPGPITLFFPEATSSLEKVSRPRSGANSWRSCRSGWKVGDYLGALEHTWLEGAVRHFEVNHCFEVTMPSLSAIETPRSFAKGLEFYWASVANLKAHNLQPPSLCCILVPHWM